MTLVNEHHDAPAEHNGFEHVGVLLRRTRMEWLLQHFPARLVWAIYVCVNGFITIGLLGLLAFLTGSPFVFPSLGPTAYLFSFPHWLKSPARVIPSWGTQLDSSVGTLRLPLRLPRVRLLVSAPVSMAQGCWPLRSRFRLLAHSWHFCG